MWSKKVLIFAIPACAVVVFLGIVFVRTRSFPLQKQEVVRPFPSLSVPVRKKLPNEDKYTVSNNILPLEDNTQGSVYSKRAQIRGTLLSWESDFAVVDTKGERLRIHIPSPVHVYCIAKTVAGKTVEDIDLNTVMIDLSQIDRNAGTSMTRGEVLKLFPINSSLYVLVDVGEKDSLTAYLLVGISCANPP